MRIELTPIEARVLGSLIEKEVTTPEQYPLSLSSLTHACNQKSSRDPVLQLTESEVQETVDGLLKKHLVSDRGGFGSRVTKYQHRFCNAGFGSLEFSTQELGILCVLMLRGAQTPGELRSRTNRLCDFSDVIEAEGVLNKLMEREDGPFVARLAREPGKRESRFVHLFCGAEQLTEPASVETVDKTASEALSNTTRDHLETLLLEMQDQLEALEARVRHLEEQRSEIDDA